MCLELRRHTQVRYSTENPQSTSQGLVTPSPKVQRHGPKTDKRSSFRDTPGWLSSSAWPTLLLGLAFWLCLMIVEDHLPEPARLPEGVAVAPWVTLSHISLPLLSSQHPPLSKISFLVSFPGFLPIPGPTPMSALWKQGLHTWGPSEFPRCLNEDLAHS